MYAKITSTTWTNDQPARSTLQRCDREFYHEIGCPAQGSYQDCTCYVSRIRLVKTPVGEFIPTTEPDLSPELDFWQERSDRLWRSNKTLSTLLLVSSAAGITALVGFALEAGLLG